MNKIEIMSPAGNFETLRAAIQGGADSVYFGISKLNMRAKSANNFKTEDLPTIVEICSAHNVRTYLTVNTIIYDRDLALMREIILQAKEAGITAIIASDLAVIQYAFSQGVEIHASTQLNICNTEAVKFFARYVDVMVLARELSLKQVKTIYKAIEEEDIRGPAGELVQLELFGHGALCMAVSGKCYLSLHEKKSSANRGSCTQTCRHGYTVKNKETGYELDIDNEYIMSPKDLSTIYFLDKIIDSGITVLKIEGRARPPEYVKTVTRVYREAADAVEAGEYTRENIERWEADLKRVFNRGFWDGYYLGRTYGEWSEAYGSKATRRKHFIGQVSNFFSKIGVAEITMKADTLSLGDEVLLIGETTGVVETVIKEIRKDYKTTDTAEKGDIISIAVPEKVRRNDKLYKLIVVEE